MALDENTPCFFVDEEFYEDSPGKDHFKKFQLYTITPPQSPEHDPFQQDFLPPNGHSESEGSDSVESDSGSEPDLGAPSNLDEFYNLPSILIQDCMWSGPFLAAAGLGPESSVLLSKRLKKLTSVCQTSSTAEGTLPGAVDINSSECVDPAAVFPYPVSTETAKPSTYNLGSTAETPSPSESEDEEEIDVVTVVDKLARKKPVAAQSQQTPTSFSSHVAAIHNYSSSSSSCPVSYSAPQSPQACTGRHTSHHYSHKRSRPLSMPASPQPLSKKSRSLLHSTDLKRVAQKLRLNQDRHSHSYSRMSSDSEDGDGNKRAQHNVLERKRRDDLKWSFARLRDNVPDLAKQERTPKVTILKKSSDFAYWLTAQNSSLEREYEKHKQRLEYLKSKLLLLRKSLL